MNDAAELIRLKMIITQTFKGGPGSGNFGHEGRPGEVGGSGGGNNVNQVVGIIGSGNYKKEIIKINDDARFLLDGGIYTIAVSVKGNNKGTIIAAKGLHPHSELVHNFDKTDNIDNYVRFNSHKGVMEANQNQSGVTRDDPDFASKSLDNIYKSGDMLVNMGLPRETSLTIWLDTQSGDKAIKFYNTTLKMRSNRVIA